MSSWLKYSLVGENAERAVERGLAEAEWYTSPVDRSTMRALLERCDGPALRDTTLWFGLIGVAGYGMVALYGTLWFVAPFLLYSMLYGGTSDSRWHEAGHGTAFRTDWMNNVLYEVASFMVMRESVVWRWSHTRHHSDTIIVGRDPEIASPQPPDLAGFVKGFFPYEGIRRYFVDLWKHARGCFSARERAFLPESELPKVRRNALITLGLYGGVVVWAVTMQSFLPLFFVGLPNLFGGWVVPFFGHTQHTGLAENVLDHRLNCRTVLMNPVCRFLYWNMNYHLEHHMFPLVPYHRLGRLHEVIKADCPSPYPGLRSAWREIITTLLRQRKDPSYYVKRRLPPPTPRATEGVLEPAGGPDANGWLDVCEAGQLGANEVVRFDHGKCTYVLVRGDHGALFATDGICTHGNQHLADGLVKGGMIECPKHNGRFHLGDGSPARAPICRGLAVYPVEIRNRRLVVNVSRPGGAGARPEREWRLRVVSNRNVSTFIKELTLEPQDPAETVPFQPGDFMRLRFPAYTRVAFSQMEIDEPYAEVWRQWRLFDLQAANPEPGVNNYSLASHPAEGPRLKFNIRIAMPPPGQDCPPGRGSSWFFMLKPGDDVIALGPSGDFRIRPTKREMIYIGGGAGMGPLRSHIMHLFDVEKTARNVSFWYASRSLQEVYYQHDFEALAARHPNFSFHLSLSSPLPTDHWQGLTGRMHEVVEEHGIRGHSNLPAVEFYLCGPPRMVDATVSMLRSHGVKDAQIAFDAF